MNEPNGTLRLDRDGAVISLSMTYDDGTRLSAEMDASEALAVGSGLITLAGEVIAAEAQEEPTDGNGE